MYAFYGILAIVAVALTVTHPKETFICIAAAPFCFVGIYSFVKAFNANSHDHTRIPRPTEKMRVAKRTV